MTSLAIGERWNMIGIGPRDGCHWRGWQEVIVAWAAAGMLVGALLFAVPRHDTQSAPASLWSLGHAGHHAHRKAVDSEGPTSDEACSDRDYANELC